MKHFATVVCMAFAATAFATAEVEAYTIGWVLVKETRRPAASEWRRWKLRLLFEI